MEKLFIIIREIGESTLRECIKKVSDLGFNFWVLSNIKPLEQVTKRSLEMIDWLKDRYEWVMALDADTILTMTKKELEDYCDEMKKKFDDKILCFTGYMDCTKRGLVDGIHFYRTIYTKEAYKKIKDFDFIARPRKAESYMVNKLVNELGFKWAVGHKRIRFGIHYYEINQDKDMKKALITGITGQDGSFLAELLIQKGYEVYGLIRRTSVLNTKRIDHIKDLKLIYGDLTDMGSLKKAVFNIEPEEIYNLAGQSQVAVSFDVPEYTAEVNGIGVLKLLEVLRLYEKQTGLKIKFYQASTSEMFGDTPALQDENSRFNPKSPYGVAKLFAHHTVRNYREGYRMYACCGILFNHESERRGETFVTRKITRGIAKISKGLEKKLYLGNLKAKRDWGYAPEYMEAIYLILQQEKPEDFVIGTGETHTVEEFVKEAFKCVGIDNWQDYVEIDQKFVRPSEVNELIANPAKAKEILKWEAKTKFKDIVKIMMEAESKNINNERIDI